MNAIDTNIWIYSHDTRDPQKRLAARNLIATLRPLALPWQVGCEFIAAGRKRAPWGFDEAQAWSALADMQAMVNVVLMPAPQLWQATQSLQTRHALSFWDALLVAACVHGGIQVLYTGHGRTPSNRRHGIGKSVPGWSNTLTTPCSIDVSVWCGGVSDTEVIVETLWKG